MDITTAFKQYLTIKDYQFSVDDNFIKFKHDGWNMVLLVNDNDPYYFRLVLPRLVSITDENANALMKKALLLSGEYKVAKAVIFQNDIWIFFEEILSDYDFKNSKLFDRAIVILSSFAKDIKDFEAAQGETKQDEP